MAELKWFIDWIREMEDDSKREYFLMSLTEPQLERFGDILNRLLESAQIAAKLRTLNGEPNTRSTDESDLLGRVRKLYDHTKSKAWSTKSPHYKYAVRIRELFPELFPACKPSEGNQNG